MPLPDQRWYHVTIGTYNSWLPGDPRGFRTRDHKIHSSGHHKNPPPKGEHAGLHAYSRAVSGPPTIIPGELRPIVGQKIVARLHKHDQRVLIASVGGMHVHLLAELPDSPPQAKHLIGIAKKTASQAIGDAIPGQAWARGCGLKPIRDAEHQRNMFNYIRRHGDEGAFVWTFRDGV